MVHTEIHDGVATITLQRPHRLNALTWETMADIRATIIGLTDHGAAGDEVRALVITGAGRSFCAGLDLIDLAESGDIAAEVEREMVASLTPMCRAIAEAPVPVVAAVNGPCAGGGLGLALLADITIAAESSYFLVPQVSSLGVLPDAGATWVLPRLVGRARALGMSLTGDRIDATQAERWGLIWRCVPDGELLTQAHDIATELGRRSDAVVATRALFDGAMSAGLPEQLGAETQAQAIALRSADALASITRFTTKTPRDRGAEA